MPSRDGAEIRRERLNKLVDLVKDHEEDQEWMRNRTVGIFMLQTGLTPEKINSYIDQLVELGIIQEENGHLSYGLLSKKVSP